MKETVENALDWAEQLPDEERGYIELLDGFFQFRSNMPDLESGFHLFEDFMTTADIVDYLTEMAAVPQRLVYQYMLKHNYGFRTMKDGSVKWAVWRMP